MNTTATTEELSCADSEAASENSTPREDSLRRHFSKAKVDPSAGQEARRSLSFKRLRKKSSMAVLPMDPDHLRAGVASSFFSCFEGVLGQERYRCVKSNIFLSEGEILVRHSNPFRKRVVYCAHSRIQVLCEMLTALYGRAQVQSGNERLQLDVQSLKSVEITKEFKNGLYVFKSKNGDLLQLVGECYSSSSKRTAKMKVQFRKPCCVSRTASLQTVASVLHVHARYAHLACCAGPDRFGWATVAIGMAAAHPQALERKTEPSPE
eukprot:270810-Pleurochrysis_carterae.AAC.1